MRRSVVWWWVTLVVLAEAGKSSSTSPPGFTLALGPTMEQPNKSTADAVGRRPGSAIEVGAAKPETAASRQDAVVGDKRVEALPGPPAARGVPGESPVDKREEIEETMTTRSPKLDVEWVVPSRRPLRPLATFDPDADAEVLNVTTKSASTTTTSTPTVIFTPSVTEPPTTTKGPTTTITPTPPPPTTTLRLTTASVATTSAASTTDFVTGSGTDADPSAPPRPVVPKCCPPGQRVLSEKKTCVASPLEFIPPFVEYEEIPEAAIDGSLEDYGDQGGVEPGVTEAEGYDMIVGNPCRYGRFRLEPRVDSRDEFYLLANGSLVAPFLFDAPLGLDEFCMDVFPDTDHGDVMVLPLVCFPAREGPQRTGIQFILYPIGLLLSVPFLLTTLVLYAITPALRDVHGKALMCQVTCQSVAYVTLACLQLWGAYFDRSLCFIAACIVQFSFFTCFLWLNVMCINMWYNMALRPAEKWCKRAERRRFVLYSMYAWSLPCVLLGVTLVMDLTPTIPSSYVKPRFGVDTCWFQTDRAALPYFYAPVTFLVVMNLVLFVMTACSVHRGHRRRALNASAASVSALDGDTCYKRHSSIAFRSCIYLFMAMGINWVMEVVSFFAGGPPFIWYVTDTLNCLQGAWTFIIFVLNRPARREVRARLVQLHARAFRSAGDEVRIREHPQIDDFQTVVQRQSRLSAQPSPWQRELGVGGEDEQQQQAFLRQSSDSQ